MSAMDVFAVLGWLAAVGLSVALVQRVGEAREQCRRAGDCERDLLRQQRLVWEQEHAQRELKSAVRAERAHVEQLERKVGVFREEAQEVRAALHQALGQLAEAQREGGLVHLRYAQLLEEYRGVRGR
ncbi:hypothetical protein [Pseudomonas sp. NPDC007930]|uniref:hypothetical protein n=1 Tax=Pseudomonas sp. NPDC007930 TaxID=3364417 RepID=UPI0036E04B09